MPKFRQLPKILQLMKKTECIRNLGIVAHIDHGKTTLADSLLAGTGLLSSNLVGSARVLDYLKEEQIRGITMKSANVSLLYQTDVQSFIINLVDTPGHVDFTGKVRRALRSVDSVIVVVDAVEEIMAQTEIVIRQALMENVHPVLFINKVDRLITELKLDEAQIQKKFERIIKNFNDLLSIYGTSKIVNNWKISPQKGNVVFGSALHRWGFNLTIARTKRMKFSTIIDAYKNKKQETIAEKFPLHKAIFNMIITQTPNPKDAQKYRIQKIWQGDISSTIGQAMIKCDRDGPIVMCITKVHTNQDSELMVTGRLFSGTVKKGSKIFLANAQIQEEIKEVFIYMSSFKERVTQISAGNLVALSGFRKALPGETIVDLEYMQTMIPFEKIKYFSEPVTKLSIEPKNPQEIDQFLDAINKLIIEDPNLVFSIDDETGEYLLAGMGELHLEVAIKLLDDYLNGISLVVSPPKAVYGESATRNGSIAKAISPNKQNQFTIQIENLDTINTDVIQEGSNIDFRKKIIAEDNHENVFIDATKQSDELPEILKFIISGFTFACKSGPLCGEPLRGLKIKLLDFKLSKNKELSGPGEIMRGVGKAIFGSFLTGKPRLFEPTYKIDVYTPAGLEGTCIQILRKRRCKIAAFEQKGFFSILHGIIPVSETFGLSMELRSMSSGRTFWYSTINNWIKIPKEIEKKIIKNLRKQKGLPIDLPAANQFMEENACN